MLLMAQWFSGGRAAHSHMQSRHWRPVCKQPDFQQEHANLPSIFANFELRLLGGSASKARQEY